VRRPRAANESLVGSGLSSKSAKHVELLGEFHAQVAVGAVKGVDDFLGGTDPGSVTRSRQIVAAARGVILAHSPRRNWQVRSRSLTVAGATGTAALAGGGVDDAVFVGVDHGLDAVA
jgi:hypothetical protein